MCPLPIFCFCNNLHAYILLLNKKAGENVYSTLDNNNLIGK